MTKTEKLLVLDTLSKALGFIDSLEPSDLTTAQQLVLSVLRIDIEASHKVILEN